MAHPIVNPDQVAKSASAYLGYQSEANLPLSGECFPFVNELFPSFAIPTSYLPRSSSACRPWLGTPAEGSWGGMHGAGKAPGDRPRPPPSCRPTGTVAKRALPQNTETTTTAAHNLTGVFHFCNFPIQSMS